MAKQLTLGSLFDGSGGFPLAGMFAGIKPIWASEIEPFPIRVTTKRIPSMKHYGDVSSINGAEVEPVDIITFGSPCQDMSIAGKRQGLEGSRSNLFYEAIRIIKEMREATNERQPRYAVWENVLGAFSSNLGADFRAVLTGLCSVCWRGELSIPQPAGWKHAGEILADGFSLAWRTLDAQFWGVPQRRKRIYLVADFRGQCAGEILFESEGVSGYSAESFRAWQRTTNSIEKSFGDTGTKTTKKENVIYTPCVMALENHPADGRVTLSEDDKVQTLTSRMGTGGGNVPLIMGVQKAYGIGRDAFNQGRNAKYKPAIVEEIQPTMTARGPGAVKEPVYSFTKDSFFTHTNEELAATLEATDYKDPQIVYKKNAKQENNYTIRRLTPTECARLQGFPDWWCDDLGTDEPTDEELQFWKGIWETHRKLVSHGSKPKTEQQIKKWLKDPSNEATEYKMWGNGIALPCAAFVLSGIAYCDEKER